MNKWIKLIIGAGAAIALGWYLITQHSAPANASEAGVCEEFYAEFIKVVTENGGKHILTLDSEESKRYLSILKERGVEVSDQVMNNPPGFIHFGKKSETHALFAVGTEFNCEGFFSMTVTPKTHKEVMSVIRKERT